MSEYRRILHNRKWLLILFTLTILNCCVYTEYVKAALNGMPAEVSRSVQYWKERISGLSAEEANEILNQGKEELSARQAASFLISAGLDNEENIEKYSQRYDNFKVIIEEERVASPQNQNADLFAIGYWLDTLQYFKTYPARTEMIRENAQKLINSSTFADPSSFAFRNIEKTVHDYERCGKISVSLHSDLFYRYLSDYRLSEVFVFLSILAAVCIISESDDHNISLLTASCSKGRRFFRSVQLVSLFAVSVISVLLIRVLLLFFSSYIFGEPADLNIYVQNYACFEHFTLPLKTGQYLLLSSVYEILSFFFVGCLFLVLLSLFQKQLSGASAITVLIFIEYLLSGKYGVNDKFYGLTSINIFSLVSFWSYIRQYHNFNVLSVPVSALKLTASFIIICTLFLMMIRVMKRPSMEGKRREIKIVHRIRQYREISRRTVPLSVSEFRKAMIYEKGVFVPLLLILLFSQIHPGAAIRDLYLAELTEKFYGRVSESTINEIRKEKTELEEKIMSSMAPELQDQYRLNAYVKLESRYSELLADDAKDPVFLVDETYMEYLFGERGRQYRLLGLYLSMISLALLLPCFTVSESGLYALTASSVSGRKKLFRSKQLIIIISAVLIFMIHTIRDLILLKEIPAELNISCFSYEAIRLDMPLYEFFVIILLYRLLGYLIISQVLLIADTYMTCYIPTASVNVIAVSSLITVITLILKRIGFFPGTATLARGVAAHPFVFLSVMLLSFGALCINAHYMKRNESL